MKELVYISKMSVKTLGCKPVGETEPKRLCVILGKANSMKFGEDKTRGTVFTTIIGSFQGTNLETGEVFRSGKLYLPSGIQEVVEAAIKQLPEDGGQVSFAMEVRSIHATNPIGYSYQAVNLLPVEVETDELSSVIGLVAAREQKQLEAAAAPAAQPVAVEEKTAAQAHAGSKKK